MWKRSGQPQVQPRVSEGRSVRGSRSPAGWDSLGAQPGRLHQIVRSPDSLNSIILSESGKSKIACFVRLCIPRQDTRDLSSMRLVPKSVQLAFARQGAKERGERDDDWRRSDDSYSPRRHWCFRSPTKSVGPRFAYRRVMTLVSFDDDLDWEFAFDSHLGHPVGPRRSPWRRDPRNGARNCPSCTPMQPASM